MKFTLLATLVVLFLTGCTLDQGARNTPVESYRDTLREQGTTGLGAGSDTTTQTGIDTGTRSGSGLP